MQNQEPTLLILYVHAITGLTIFRNIPELAGIFQNCPEKLNMILAIFYQHIPEYSGKNID